MIIERQMAKKDFSKTVLLIHGPPKIGKTTFAHALGEYTGKPALMIMTEDGTGALDACAVRVTTKVGLDKLLESLDRQRKELSEQYSCIVVDLINEVDAMIFDWICDQKNISTVSELPHGQGWSLYQNEYKKVLAKILGLGLPVKFICHSKASTESSLGDKNHTKQSPQSNSPKMKLHLMGKADAICFMKPNGTTTSVCFKPSPFYDAGTRFKSIANDYSFNIDDPLDTVKNISDDFAGTKE